MGNCENIIVTSNDKISDAKSRGKEYCIKCDIEVWSLYTHQHCHKCGADPKNQEIRNYSMMWGDGDVYCTLCGAYVRMYDAG